jgi:hypothetical protein
MAAAAVGSLLDWCLNNGIRIDPNIRILHDEKLGICVRSANRPISPKQSRKRFSLTLAVVSQQRTCIGGSSVNGQLS